MAGKEMAKRGAEEAGKAAIKAGGAALGPEGAAAAKVVAEVPFFRKILEGGLLGVALFILSFIALIIVGIIALISVLGPLGFNNRPLLGGDPNASGGCYFPDAAFTAVKTTSADDVLKKLSKYKNLQGKKTQVQKIIDKANQNGLNYYIFLDMWSGEQSFGNDEAAFGCGVYGGENRAKGFDNQLDCATKVMLDAVNNRGEYTEPTGKDIFTRFFYNYVGGMKAYYQQYGYVAGPENPRVVLHKILAPEEVICSAGSNSGPGLALVGDKLYPPLGDKMTNGSSSGNHLTWSCHECKCCAVDYGRPAGTPVYAVADGRVEKLYLHSAEKGYTFYFYSDDGQVFAVYSHITPGGRLSMSDVNENIYGTKKVTGIKKGDQLGVLYPYHFQGNGPHLHFELHINGQPIGIRSGHNNQLDNFGSVK